MDNDIFEVFIEQLRRYVRERLIPAEHETIENDAISPEIVTEMRELGLFGLTIPVEYGGSGMSIHQYVTTTKELCYAAPAYRALIGINSGMMASALKNAGTTAQKKYWFPKLSDGAIAAFGLTEPDSGSDSAALKTTAVKKGEDYILTGTKRYITNATYADIILVMARTEKEKLPKNKHISAFLVPANSKGLSIGKPDKKLGQEGAPIADVILDEVCVGPEALLGGVEGEGFSVAMRSLDTGRLCIAACATGYAKRILEESLEYAMNRNAFGEKIAQFQLIQAMLADSYADIYAAESMLDDACGRADQGRPVSLQAASAKMFASEMCGRIADRCVQIYGGAGYVKDYPAERFFRDARLYRIYEGTTQIMQLVIARQLLREAKAFN